MLEIRVRNPQTSLLIEKALDGHTVPAAVCFMDSFTAANPPKDAALIGVYFDEEEYSRLLEEDIYVMIPVSAINTVNLLRLINLHLMDRGNPSVDFTLTETSIICGDQEKTLTRVEYQFLSLMLHSPKPVAFPYGGASMGGVVVCRLRKILRSVGSKTQIVCRRGWKQFWLDTSIPRG